MIYLDDEAHAWWFALPYEERARLLQRHPKAGQLELLLYVRTGQPHRDMWRAAEQAAIGWGVAISETLAGMQHLVVVQRQAVAEMLEIPHFLPESQPVVQVESHRDRSMKKHDPSLPWNRRRR